MLSQITFAEKSRAQEDARKDNHHNNKQKISKHRKSKSAKGGKRNSTPRHSRSPSLQDSRPTTALQGTSADAVLCTREQSPMIADIALVKDSDQMEGLLHSMSAGTSTKPAVQTKSSGECSKAAAPRLQETSGRISGLVGDGGNNWRRRMQRRAAAIQNGQGDELPRDVHHGDHTGGPKRKVHTADQSFIGSGGKMRRPAKDITSAFRRARHFELKDPARQVHNAEASRAVSAGDSGQHDGGKTTQLSGHGTRAARLDRAHPSRMVEPAPSCVDTVRGANTSAAAQLKARLRGDSIPVVLVETVCIRMFMGGLTDARKPPDQAQSDQVRRPRQLQRFADGKKQQYFEDDALHSTAALAKKARMGVDMHDIDEAMTRNILSKRHFRAQDLDVDDEYDFDAGLELSERLQGKAASKKRKPVQHDSASQPPLRAPTDLIERQCHRCFMGAKRESDLTVSVGMHAYMAIPERGSLGAGHVCIMPVGHSPSFREADDGVFEELKNFQKCLINMYEAEGMSCIFFETALRVKQSRTHACIDCVPVDADAFAAAPIMFKKEITESESEWSQHHAKSIVDTSEKGLRRCVPPKFPYFHVQYGYKRGSVHVIDDEHKWERGFGRSVLVSLTGGQEVEMYRRAQRLDSQTVMSRKYEFLKKWGRFDWTRELE